MTGTDFIFMINNSSWVIKLVLLVLLTMSVLSWSIILFKSLQLKRTRKNINKDLKSFKVQSTLRAAVKRIERSSNSPSFMAASEGIKEVNRLIEIKLPAENRDRIILDSVRNTLNDEIETQAEYLYGSLYFLGTCTTVAPLLGLFGTVWGIMNSFHGFRNLTTSNLSAIAPGLAEALITTVLGLMVAIPAALAHNILVRYVETNRISLGRFASAFLNLLQKELIDHLHGKSRLKSDRGENAGGEIK